MPKLNYLMLLALAALPLRAAEIDGLAFDADYTLDTGTLTLQGLGIARYAKIVKLYAGGLYLPEGASLDDPFQGPLRLELAYYRKITRDQMVSNADKALRKSISEAQWKQHADDLARINAWYKSVDKGDRYTLTYRPDKGLELALNGKVAGVIESPEFARLYLRIWLGEKAVSPDFLESLRKGLPASAPTAE